MQPHGSDMSSPRDVEGSSHTGLPDIESVERYVRGRGRENTIEQKDLSARNSRHRDARANQVRTLSLTRSHDRPASPGDDDNDEEEEWATISSQPSLSPTNTAITDPLLTFPVLALELTHALKLFTAEYRHESHTAGFCEIVQTLKGGMKRTFVRGRGVEPEALWREVCAEVLTAAEKWRRGDDVGDNECQERGMGNGDENEESRAGNGHSENGEEEVDWMDMMMAPIERDTGEKTDSEDADVLVQKKRCSPEFVIYNDEDGERADKARTTIATLPPTPTPSPRLDRHIKNNTISPRDASLHHVVSDAANGANPKNDSRTTSHANDIEARDLVSANRFATDGHPQRARRLKRRLEVLDASPTPRPTMKSRFGGESSIAAGFACAGDGMILVVARSICGLG